ncbi:putative nuclear transport factor 2 [Zootermopsis nevadensis]|uniref:Putative nuclear transport factor 2 n=1 Tax=Zootermopsis nevadensis TaxID=136037 RepID=A0A067R933_ZOONE|nr:putative nuclear transport factor 2 [Zootermopsis nevadensis]
MTLNPAYEAIGKGFVQQYYAIFDDPTQRPNLINMYNAESSFMTFEGLQIQGAIKIMEKLNSLSFQKINRIITAVDSQPMFDGGVLINVLGRLQTDEDPPHAYIQTFVLKPIGTSFYVQHDLFRLALHDSADEDPPHAYSQVFVLKPLGNSFFCQHDIFRLGIHDTA